jgi:hypothetical protein
MFLFPNFRVAALRSGTLRGDGPSSFSSFQKYEDRIPLHEGACKAHLDKDFNRLLASARPFNP